MWATRLDMVDYAHPTKALSHGIFYGNSIGIYYGIAIAVTVRSLDPSLISRLIAHYSLSRSLDLFVRLIPIYATELFRIPLAFLSVII